MHAGATLEEGLERAPVLHFVDTDGHFHPEFEPAWSELEKTLGSATPVLVTVELTDDGISRFDGVSQRLVVDRSISLAEATSWSATSSRM